MCKSQKRHIFERIRKLLLNSKNCTIIKNKEYMKNTNKIFKHTFFITKFKEYNMLSNFTTDEYTIINGKKIKNIYVGKKLLNGKLQPQYLFRYGIILKGEINNYFETDMEDYNKNKSNYQAYQNEFHESLTNISNNFIEELKALYGLVKTGNYEVAILKAYMHYHDWSNFIFPFSDDK